MNMINDQLKEDIFVELMALLTKPDGTAEYLRVARGLMANSILSVGDVGAVQIIREMESRGVVIDCDDGRLALKRNKVKKYD